MTDQLNLTQHQLEEVRRDLMHRFLVLTEDDLDEGFDYTLRTIGTIAQVDRAYLFQFSPDGTTMTNTHEWCAEGITPYISELVDLTVADFGFMMGFFERGTYMHVPRVADLPAEAKTEKEEFTKEGIQSILCVPIRDERDELIGFMGFDAVQREINWSEDALVLLSEIAQIFGFILVRVRNAQALAKAQSEATHILQTAALPLAITYNESGLVAYLNEEMGRLIGIDQDSVINHVRAADFFVDPEEEQRLIDNITALGEVTNQQVELRRTDDSTFWAMLSARPYLYQNQPSLLLSITDLTHLHELEQARFEQYAFYQNLVNTLPLGLFAKDIRQNNKYVVWNKQLEKMFGISAKRQLGRMDENLYEPQVAEEYGETDQLLLESDTTAVDIPAITIQTDDGERIIHTRKILIKQDDTPAAIVGIVEDVTERLRAAETLNVRTRAIEASIDPISIADAQAPDMPLIYVNKAFERITGYTAEEVIGKNCRFLQGDDTDQPAIDKLRTAIRERRDCVVELRNYRKNGELFWNELQTSPVFNDAGELTHFIGVQNDITSRKKSEERLTAALQQTESLFTFTSQLNTATSVEDILLAMRTPFINSGMLFANLFTIDTDANNEPEWIELKANWVSPQASLPASPQELGLRFHVPSYPGGSAWVSNPNQAFIIEDTHDLSQVDEATSQVYQQFNARSTITLPLRARENWIGLVAFFWSEKQTFDQRDHTVLSTMATQAAVALNNIFLLQETRTALTETRIMNRISQALTTAVDLNQGIADLLDALQDNDIALDADHISLTAIQGDAQGSPVYAELIGWWQKENNPAPIPYNTSIQVKNLPLFREWARFPLSPVFVSDHRQDDRFLEIDHEIFAQTNIRAAVILPLANAGRWVGVLSIGWAEPQTFTERVERIYQTLIIQTPSAFENRYLANQTEASLRETATLYEVAQLLNSNESIHDGLQAMVATLQRNEFLTELASLILYRLETDQAGDPDWSEVMGSWADTTAVSTAQFDPLETRIHLPDHPFNQLWLENPSQITHLRDTSEDERLSELSREGFIHKGIAAMAVLPLLIGGRWIGQLTFNWAEPHALREGEQRLLRGLASQIATTLDNRLLLEQTNRALRETRTINRISQAITQASSLEDVLENVRGILAQADLIPDSQRLVLYNLRTDTQNNPIQATSVGQWLRPGTDVQPLANLYDLQGDALAALWTQHTAVPLIIANIQTDPRLDPAGRQTLQKLNIGALIMLPLVSSGRWVGLVSIDWETPRTFTTEDHSLFTALLPQVATGLANQQLFEQAQRRAAQLEIVARVSTVSASILDEEEMLTAVAELAKRSFDFYHTHIYLFNEGGDTLTLAAGAGQVGRQMLAENHGIALDHPQSLVARAARTRQSQVLQDTSHEANYLPHPLLQETRSAMSLPMVSGDSLLGVLNIQSDLPQNFDEEDVRIQNTLATQIAIALQNIRSFESSEKTRRELSVLTRRLTRTGWEDYLREKQTSSNLSFAYDRQRIVPLIDRTGDDVAPNGGTNGHAPDSSPPQENGHILARILRVQGQPIGRLALDTPQELTDEADDIMSAVATNLSAHIENLRLTEQTQEALQETEMLYEFGNKLNAAQTQEEILRAVSELPGPSTADVITLVNVEEYTFEPETAVLTAGWLPTMNQSAPSEQLGLRTNLADVPVSRLWIEDPSQTIILDDLRQSDPESVTFYTNLGIQAIVIIPLTSRGRVFGLISFSWFTTQNFTEQTRRLFRAINGQISTAANNQLLLEQTRIRAQLLETLAHLEGELSQSSSNEDIVRTLATNIPNFTGAVSLQHLELNEKHEPITQIPRVMWIKGRLRPDDPRLNQPVPLHLLPTSPLWIENPSQVLYVEDGAHDERLDEVGREIYRKLGLGSVALLPLRSGGVWQGTVVFSTAEAYTFTDDQKFILGRLLESLSAIVASIRALEAQRAALAESEALYGASVRFNRANSVDDVLQVIATSVSDAGAFSSALWLLETNEQRVPKKGTLTAVWQSDGSESSVPIGTVLDLDNLPGADYWRYSPENIMLVADPKTDPRVKDDANYQAVLDMGGYVATAALPLTIGNRWVGVCTVQWKTTFDFDETDMRLYTTLAAQAAVTVDGLLLLQETQERAKQLELQARIEAQLSRAVDEIDILHAIVDNLIAPPITSLGYIETDAAGQPEFLRNIVAHVNGEVTPLDPANSILSLNDLLISKLWIENPQTPLIIEDIIEDKRVDDATRESLAGFRSFAFLPLYSGGRWQGGITFAWLEKHTFAATEQFVFQQILESVSAVVASRRSQLEQAAAEAALREVTTLQQGILNSANYSIISTDPEGIIATVNAAAERLLGYDAQELIGKARPSILHDFNEIEQRAIHLSDELGQPIEPGFETFVAKARDGGIDEYEWTYLRKDGSYFPVALSVTSLRNDRDELVGFLFVASNITERKRAEAAALAAQEETEQLYLASRQINEAAGNLSELLSTLGTIHKDPFDRALLLFFDYDPTGKFKAGNVVTTWNNGRGSAPSPVGTRYNRDLFPSIDLFLTNTSIFYEDTRTIENLDPQSQQLLQHLSILTMGILPLWVSGQQVGVILLEGQDTYHMNDTFKRPYLSLLPQVTVAVENRLLLDRAQARARREQVLREITEKVRSSTDVNTIMRTAASEIGRALGRKTVVGLGAPESEN